MDLLLGGKDRMKFFKSLTREYMDISLISHLRHKWAWYGLSLWDKLVLKMYGIDYKEWDKEIENE